MKNKILIIVSFLLLGLTLITVVSTYSLFESNTLRVVEANIGKWTVKINNGNVTNESFNIDNLIWDNEGYAVNNKAIPGGNSYFDIVIDPMDTQVSIKYDITFDFSNITNEKIIIDSISEINNNTLVRTGEFTYTGVITLNDINFSVDHQIRVVIIWINDEENNGNDSMLADSDILIPVNVNASQYLGEEIIPYVSIE